MVREWSGGPPGGLRVVGRPSRRSGRGLEALPKVQKALPDIREWSLDPHGGPGVVGRPSRWSARPTQGPGVVGWPSQRSGRLSLIYWSGR